MSLFLFPGGERKVYSAACPRILPFSLALFAETSTKSPQIHLLCTICVSASITMDVASCPAASDDVMSRSNPHRRRQLLAEDRQCGSVSRYTICINTRVTVSRHRVYIREEHRTKTGNQCGIIKR